MKQDVRQLIHTPAEMMQDFVAWAESIKRDPGIQFGIPAIDKKVIPLRAGNLVSIIARPGHAKTSLLVYLARQEARRIIEQGREGQNVVVYVTWEQASEELTSMLLADPQLDFTKISWGDADLDLVKRRAVKGARMPVWIIGHGIGGANTVIRMTPEVVLESIETMQADFNLRPSLVLCDYLQLIPTRVAKERVQQVTEMPIKLKELALRIKVPVVAAVQAARAVDDRNPPIPEMTDAQWASSIEQTSDKIFGLWRPIRTFQDKIKKIDINGEQYAVTDNLMVIRLLKQRGERGRYTWAMYFDPALMRLAEIESERR